jgi:polyhydroxybutyrate depolymerase
MACEHSDVVDGVLSLAGATFDDPADCAPANPVRVIQVHGTADTTILYDGGLLGTNPYPSAEQTAATWAGYNGCGAEAAEVDPLDLMPGADAETTREVWGGCDAGGGAELWTVPLGAHIPAFSRGFGAIFYDELVGQ